MNCSEEMKETRTSEKTENSTRKIESEDDIDPFSEEGIREFCRSDDDEPVRMKCTKCGHEEDVPRWVIGEVADMLACQGKDGREASLECPECHGSMKIKR